MSVIFPGVLVKEINKELTELPKAIEKVSKETSQAVENLVNSIKDEEMWISSEEVRNVLGVE